MGFLHDHHQSTGSGEEEGVKSGRTQHSVCDMGWFRLSVDWDGVIIRCVNARDNSGGERYREGGEAGEGGGVSVH